MPSDAPVDAEGKPLRFSTDFLPARDRLAIWREVIGRTVARLDLAPLGPGPFRSDTTSRILPDLSVTALSITAVRSQRTRELIADGNDDVLLIRINEGGGLLSHRGREIELGGGQGVIFSNAEVSSVSIPRLSHGLSLRLPRKVLVPLVPHLDDAIMSRIPAGAEASGRSALSPKCPFGICLPQPIIAWRSPTTRSVHQRPDSLETGRSKNV